VGCADLKINQQSVKWAELKMRLKDIFKARAEKVAFSRRRPSEFRVRAT